MSNLSILLLYKVTAEPVIPPSIVLTSVACLHNVSLQKEVVPYILATFFRTISDDLLPGSGCSYNKKLFLKVKYATHTHFTVSSVQPEKWFVFKLRKMVSDERTSLVSCQFHGMKDAYDHRPTLNVFASFHVTNRFFHMDSTAMKRLMIGDRLIIEHWHFRNRPAGMCVLKIYRLPCNRHSLTPCNWSD